MRRRPFATTAELDAYLSGDRVQCLECGRRYRNLGQHVRMHGMTPDDYRDKWAIPRGRGLAGRATREILSRQNIEMREAGILDNAHLPAAAKNIDYAARTAKTPVSEAVQKTSMRTTRPWAHHEIPPGEKRADGRDADRAREYQRAYRALKTGDPKPMAKYRKKWSV